MKARFTGSIITLAILAFAAAFLSQYTPHPNTTVVLGFAVAHTFFLQLRLDRLKRRIAFREARHERLVSRVDRMEWEVIYSAFKGRTVIDD